MSAVPNIIPDKAPRLHRAKAAEMIRLEETDEAGFAAFLPETAPGAADAIAVEAGAAEEERAPVADEDVQPVAIPDLPQDIPAPVQPEAPPVPHFLLSFHENAMRDLRAAAGIPAAPAMPAGPPEMKAPGLPAPAGEAGPRPMRPVPAAARAATVASALRPVRPDHPQADEVSGMPAAANKPPPAADVVPQAPVLQPAGQPAAIRPAPAAMLHSEAPAVVTEDPGQAGVTVIARAQPAAPGPRRDEAEPAGDRASVTPRVAVVHAVTAGETEQRDDRPAPDKPTPPAPPSAAAPARDAALPSASGFQIPPAEQLSDKLLPTISQAQKILRLLSEVGTAVPVVRTLQLGLHPQDLGALRVTLRLSGERLDLKVETQTPEAAQSLEQDRSLLGGLLREAGVMTQTVQIEVKVGNFDMGLTRDGTAARNGIGADVGAGGGAAGGFTNRDGAPEARTPLAAGPGGTGRSLHDAANAQQPSQPLSARGIYL